MGRRGGAASADEQLIVAGLARTDHVLAARALRRHRAWRQAVDASAGGRAQRSLRRAWERARDDALVALGVVALSAQGRGGELRRSRAPRDAQPSGSRLTSSAR